VSSNIHICTMLSECSDYSNMPVPSSDTNGSGTRLLAIFTSAPRLRIFFIVFALLHLAASKRAILCSDAICAMPRMEYIFVSNLIS
jgi:hypothetical protein